MMDIVAGLANRPLTAAEVEEIRSLSPVDQCIVVGAGTRPRRAGRHRRGADDVRQAVVLANGSLFAVRLGPHGWTGERLASDADGTAALDAALDLFYDDPSGSATDRPEASN